MNITETNIHLHGMETYIPQDEKTAYRVLSGTILLYIVPWVKDKPGRRVLLGEVPQGRVIPSFVHRDMDYKEWRFVLAAKEEVELQIMPSSVTSALLRNFSRRIGLNSFEEEGFENSLVEFYRREVVKDDVFIKRGEKKEPVSKMASYGVIKDAFDTDKERIDGDDPNYKAVVFACRYMGQKPVSFERLSSLNKKKIDVPDVAQASHIICRSVVLDVNWYQTDTGVVIGKTKDSVVTCIPSGQQGYRVYDAQTGKTEKLTKELAEQIDPRAYVLGRTLPDKKLTFSDLVHFCKKGMRKGDVAAIVLLGLVTALIGILLPTLNQKVYDDYIPLGNYGYLIQFCLLISTFMIGNLFFNVVKELSEFRIQSRVGYELQDAVYYRIFHLPESFFRNYESADLAQRLMGVGRSANQYVDAVFISGISTLFSVVYLIRMFKYTAKLTWVALAMVLIYALLMALINMSTLKYEKKAAEYKGESSSKLYQYLNGIEKIRMAGVEDQATYEYLVPFAQEQTEEIKQNRISSAGMVLSGAASTIFSMILYFAIVKWKLDVSMGSFIGFNTALGIFSASIMQLIDKLMSLYQLKPIYERFKPILEAVPEDNSSSELPGKLSGAIDVNHVTFSYGEGRPIVLNDIDLHVKPGEYLGIVGSSGCGKSTLLKLLLGFETPNSGQVTFDGKDLAALDKQAFRQNLGVVLQNGRLISGSIYENITITAPEATMKDVNRVVEAVGLKDDIAQMPMGIHTVLTENSSTISGGQMQRILIARAIIRNPSILIFDEATSALDNITQAAVCESLDKMNVTRLVIAHRLSTIRTCDRIIVLSGGNIAEEGNFDSLMQKKGLFYQLASRQIAE